MLPQIDQSSILDGQIHIGSAPDIIKPVNAERWQLRLIITFCPLFVNAIPIARLPAVEPFSKKKVFSAPNAFAASSCASAIGPVAG